MHLQATYITDWNKKLLFIISLHFPCGNLYELSSLGADRETKLAVPFIQPRPDILLHGVQMGEEMGRRNAVGCAGYCNYRVAQVIVEKSLLTAILKLEA